MEYLGHDAESTGHADLANTNNGDLASGVRNRRLDLCNNFLFGSRHDNSFLCK